VTKLALQRADFATGLAIKKQVGTVSDHQSLQEVQEAIGYSFNDPDLLTAALTHSSSADNRLKSNERLEFLGDAVLGMVVCDELFKRFPELLEGELTKIKSAVVSRRSCAIMARDMKLTDHLLLGKGMNNRARLPQSLAAAVYESLVAAIYIDGGGIAPARDFILRTVSEHIDKAAESEHQLNYKSQLQQYSQKHLAATPIYELLDEKGPDHSKCFEVGVVIAGRRYETAWGPSKKEAEQKAAYQALCELQIIEEEYEAFEPEPTDFPDTESSDFSDTEAETPFS
jgi:ribonuclease-3